MFLMVELIALSRFYKMIFAVRKRFDNNAEARPLRAGAEGASDAASAVSATGTGNGNSNGPSA